ncbi:hypothetical protein KC19_5G036200 [Ceratodon purpureus]|uniref:Uncharacterized protein n=1 Tax=Ceratodon purpureus TaxID=3225 RepID=A0A8T0HZY6_CERPU|nr:hypothetical protein KC19_5G036200 [Ceratodon purpureus]
MAHSCDISQFGGSLQPKRRARRGLEGGPISEDRFLQLQSEVYRLRREANAREDEHKLLVARLSRAEDAAKRNMRDCFQQSLEPCKMKTNIIAAVNHTFYVDQKMQELDDKLREKQREIVRITEFNRQYKADIYSLRTRLDIILRQTRRTTPFVSPRDISSAGSEKGAKELRKEVQKLQTENLNLQFQISSLSQPPPSREAESQSSQDMQDNGTQAEEGELPGECVLKQSLQSAQEASAKFVSAQMLETWQQLDGLQIRYDKSMAELQTLKQNHEKLLGKLRDANQELNEERRKSMRLEMSEKRLSQELLAAQQTRALLQQARQQNLQLERENNELIAAALRTHVKPKPNKVEDKVIVPASQPQESLA